MSANITVNNREILNVKDTASSTPSPLTSTNGRLNVNVPGFVAQAFDEVDIPSYNANGDPTSVIYKSGGVAIATLTISYNADGYISSVVKS